jgi:hypothetical protein
MAIATSSATFEKILCIKSYILQPYEIACKTVLFMQAYLIQLAELPEVLADH